MEENMKMKVLMTKKWRRKRDNDMSGRLKQYNENNEMKKVIMAMKNMKNEEMTKKMIVMKI